MTSSASGTELDGSAVPPTRDEPPIAGGGVARSGRRSSVKRQIILDIATAVFVEKGYRGASMDDVAARAGVSKQTVYRHFGDKSALFVEIIERAGQNVSSRLLQALEGIDDIDDPEPALREVARRLLATIHEPGVLQMRRLVIGEAGRFPDLGQIWYQRGFQRGISSLARVLESLASRGHLRIDDPDLAAAHFAGLILWVPINRAMFTNVDEIPDDETERIAGSAVKVFIAAYAR